MGRHWYFRAIPVHSPLLLASLTVLLRAHIILKPVNIKYIYVVVSDITIITDKNSILTNKRNDINFITIEFNSSVMLLQSSGSSSQCALTSENKCEYIIT